MTKSFLLILGATYNLASQITELSPCTSLCTVSSWWQICPCAHHLPGTDLILRPGMLLEFTIIKVAHK